jgi:thioredoxin 1
MSGIVKIRPLAIILFALCLRAGAQPLLGAPQSEEPGADSSQQIADKIVNSKKPVLVDFWALWCAPCRMLNPVLKTLEKEYKGKALFLKVNVDVHRQISAYFGIQGIPAVFIINNAAVQKVLVGFHPAQDYRNALDSVIKAAKPPKVKQVPEAKADSAL